MKKVVLMIIALTISTASLLTAASEKPLLAILPFEATGGIQQTDADSIYELLVTKVITTNKYKVVERSLINKLMEEHRFVMSDFVDNNDIVKLGKMLSTEWVVIGSIGRIGSRFTMVVRMVNINTGINEKASSITETSIERLSDKINELVAQITSMSDKTVKLSVVRWGLEIHANAVVMNGNFYGGGAGVGVVRTEGPLFGTGAWAGALMKSDGRMYVQGGVKLTLALHKMIKLTINLSMLPAIGTYIGNGFIEFSPLWAFGYSGFGVGAGYVFNL